MDDMTNRSVFPSYPDGRPGGFETSWDAAARQRATQAQAAEPNEAAARLAANRQRGIDFENWLAEGFRSLGFLVEQQVYKKTFFGKRFIDLMIYDSDGQLVGGIEAKTGDSRYTPYQRACDAWLSIFEGISITVVRDN
jgi:hypothetical protein